MQLHNVTNLYSIFGTTFKKKYDFFTFTRTADQF